MRSIKTKMLVYILPFILITIIGIISIFYRFVHQEIVNNVYAELEANAYGYSSQIETWFSEKVGAMEAVAKALESTDGSDSVMLKYLDKASEQFITDGATKLYAGTREGNFLENVGGVPEGYDARTRLWYMNAINSEKIIFTEPYIDARLGGMVVSIATRFKAPDSSIKGVAATDLSLNSISELVNSIKIGDTGYVFVIDNNTGMIVLHPDSEVLAKNITEVIPEFGDIIEAMEKDPLKKNSYHADNADKYWICGSEIEITGWTLYAVKSENETLEPVRRLMYVIIIIVAAAVVLLTFILIYSISKITKPIKELLKAINYIGSGNFSNAIPSSLITQKDEIGVFSRTVEQMRVDIRNIIENIIHTSTQNNQNITNIFEKIDCLDTYVKEVSVTTQELSVNVKEMASSTEKTTKNASAIETTVDRMARKSYESLENMETMKTRAMEVMTHSKAAWQQANETREEVEIKLQDAIKQSEVIGRISVLSDTIMQITDQTNLLSLNAAIEAAKAGELGKGFAVVAGEIKQLSDSSKEAVSQIQEVVILLQNAVAELVAASQVMLVFFKEQIIVDYENMVKTGEQYHGDAISASSVFSDFSISTEELNEAIKLIANVLNGVMITSQESADENRKITEKSVLLLNNSNDIVEIVKDTKEMSIQLMKIVENFKI